MARSLALETSRLRVEPFTEERHLTPRYVAWLNDPEVVKYSEQRHRSHSVESCREYARSFAGTPNHFWAMVATDAAIGHLGNINAYVDEQQGVADVGILVGEPAARGRGYATLGWRAVCDYLLRTLGLRKVTAVTLSVNEPMLRLMERVGMRPDGTRIRQCLWNGQEVDLVHAALFREQWLARFPTPEEVVASAPVVP